MGRGECKWSLKTCKKLTGYFYRASAYRCPLLVIVKVSVCLSHSDTKSKRRNIESRSLYRQEKYQISGP